MLPDEEEDEAGYAAFEQAMIVERNKTMIKNAEPIIDRRKRLHRGRRAAPAGPRGLIELLRRAGHTVSAVD